ncbi:hypothetical protein Lser_V15G34170 [Lactuca serriola]
MASFLKDGRLALALIIFIVITSSSHIMTIAIAARTPYHHIRQLVLRIAIPRYNKIYPSVVVEVEVVFQYRQNDNHVVRHQVRDFVRRDAVEGIKWEMPYVAKQY